MASESYRAFALICLALLLIASACRQMIGLATSPSDNKPSVIVENGTIKKIGNSPGTVPPVAPSDNKSSATVENTTLPKPDNSPSTVSAAPQDNRAPTGPIIKVGVSTADQMGYGQTLNVEIAVANHGDVAVRNIHLYCKSDSGGAFIGEVVDRPFVVQDAGNEDISLDDLNPGDQEIVNFSIQSPQFSQIKGEWSQNFHFDFTIASDNTPASKVAVVTLSTRRDKILVQTSGFSQ